MTMAKSCCRGLHMLQLVQHQRIPMVEALQPVGSACQVCLPYTALCLPALVHTAGRPAPGQLCAHEHAGACRGQLDVAHGRRFGVGPCQEGGGRPAGTGAQDQPLAGRCHSLSSRNSCWSRGDAGGSGVDQPPTCRWLAEWDEPEAEEWEGYPVRQGKWQ